MKKKNWSGKYAAKEIKFYNSEAESFSTWSICAYKTLVLKIDCKLKLINNWNSSKKLTFFLKEAAAYLPGITVYKSRNTKWLLTNNAYRKAYLKVRTFQAIKNIYYNGQLMT